MSTHLGINKDLEPLVRRWRREKGPVAVTRANHVTWRDGAGRVVYRSGLTMSSRTSNVTRQRLTRMLDVTHLTSTSRATDDTK